MSDFESAGDDDSFDLLETLNIASGGEQSERAERAFAVRALRMARAYLDWGP